MASEAKIGDVRDMSSATEARARSLEASNEQAESRLRELEERTGWRGLETAPSSVDVRLLVENEDRPFRRRCVIDAQFVGGHWQDAAEWMDATIHPLAWKPADSTELPADWGTGR